jgi:hypothetical protein
MTHLPTCHEQCRDHHFTGGQQAEYDSLNWRGRTLYDALRWEDDATHEAAYTEALSRHGLKRVV